jgi:hypothetical protein
MEGKLQTSFIPKQPLVESRVKKTQTSKSVFSVIGWFIFMVAVAASLGVFAYGQYLSKSIDSKNVELSNRIKSFDAATVDHFVQLDARLQAANSLLQNHTAVSTLLGLVAGNTVQSVQFTDFKYNYDEGGKISLVLSGKAPNFASVALQSDTFSAKSYLQNQVFSNLGLDQDGGVLFKFTASVDQSALVYRAPSGDANANAN